MCCFLKKGNKMIREYNSADTDAALELYIDCFQNPPFNYDWIRPDAIRRYLVDMERTPGFMGFVLDRGGVLTGMCLGHIQDYFACPAYDIKEFLVSPSCRGRGLGKMLLSGAEEAAALKGARLILISTATYLDSFEFYKKNGYMVSENTVWMGKTLF